MKKNFLLFLILITCSSVLADGKMYWQLEKVNPEIPYQRALILHKDNTETLFLQSKYSLPETADEAPKQIGWVVPLPAVPELATMDADDAHNIFIFLSLGTQPNLTKIRIFLWLGFLILYLVITITIMFKQQKKQKNTKPATPPSIVRLIFYLLVILFITSLLMPTLGTAGHSGIDIIKAESLGIYDVKVVKSNNSDSLIKWLNDSDFQFSQKDKLIFDDYINKGWCFVTATINPTHKDKKEHQIVSEGLAAPLILRFESEKPIYPMALTGTGGFDTEVLIYLATDQKMTCGSQITLRHAREYNLANGQFRWLYTEPNNKNIKMPVQPKDFFTKDDFDLSYLCKFKATLTPDQMKEDIIFTPAPDNEPYREHIVEW